MSSEANCKQADCSPKGDTLAIKIVSFGYKEGAPPPANLIFDVRFLKNPFWIDELRPLTGKDKPVQEYVMEQPLAREFIDSVIHMLDALVPELSRQEISDFTIAFGCTGGQHRSATLVETLASQIGKRYANCRVSKEHRELDSSHNGSQPVSAISQPAAGIAAQKDED